MTKIERFGIIERMLLARRNTRFADLMERLEVSRATLNRDIAEMRERMGVPIVCDRSTGYYRIDRSADRHELPGIWFSASEIHALLSMQQLIAGIDPQGLLAEQIEPLRQRLLALLESRANSATELSRRIRILHVASRKHAPQNFQTIAAALMDRRRLAIAYQARSNGQTSDREISPQRLVHYRDNWYLDAWCHLRDQLRSFSLDAIQSARVLETVAQEIPDADLDNTLGAGYGIFAGSRVQWATLKFTPQRARWVAAEQWHPAQQGESLPDGSYQLRLPYSADPELIMDILKYGPDCEVMEPAALREKVHGLLREAAKRYGDK